MLVLGGLGRGRKALMTLDLADDIQQMDPGFSVRQCQLSIVLCLRGTG